MKPLTRIEKKVLNRHLNLIEHLAALGNTDTYCEKSAETEIASRLLEGLYFSRVFIGVALLHCGLDFFKFVVELNRRKRG